MGLPPPPPPPQPVLDSCNCCPLAPSALAAALACRQPRVCRLGVPPAGPGWLLLWGPHHRAGGLRSSLLAWGQLAWGLLAWGLVCLPAVWPGSWGASQPCASACLPALLICHCLCWRCCPVANPVLAAASVPPQGADRLDQMVPDQAKRLMQVGGCMRRRKHAWVHGSVAEQLSGTPSGAPGAKRGCAAWMRLHSPSSNVCSRALGPGQGEQREGPCFQVAANAPVLRCPCRAWLSGKPSP